MNHVYELDYVRMALNCGKHICVVLKYQLLVNVALIQVLEVWSLNDFEDMVGRNDGIILKAFGRRTQVYSRVSALTDQFYQVVAVSITLFHRHLGV